MLTFVSDMSRRDTLADPQTSQNKITRHIFSPTSFLFQRKEELGKTLKVPISKKEKKALEAHDSLSQKTE